MHPKCSYKSTLHKRVQLSKEQMDQNTLRKRLGKAISKLSLFTHSPNLSSTGLYVQKCTYTV